MSAESDVREVMARIDAAWRLKQFTGLEDCFHEQAVIVGPGYVEYGRGRAVCAESYREFALNAQVLAYSESSHVLHIWEITAVYTFAWEMTYQREDGPKTERGTDQYVLEHGSSGWQVVWRFMNFQPSD
jgi:hypothetical protein